MRALLGIVAGFGTTVVVWLGLYVLSIFVGGTECDRSECNAFGEFFDEHWTITAILFLVIAIFVGLLVNRRVARGR